MSSVDIAATAHSLSADQLLKKLGVDIKKGLSDAQVVAHREKYGKNELPEEEKTSFLALFIQQFDDLLVKILLTAAIISFVLAWLEEGEAQTTAFMEPFVIGLILVANAVVGVVQETNAEKAIEALKKYEAQEAQVIRNGHHMSIPTAELVVGDIVEVSSTLLSLLVLVLCLPFI